MHAHWQVRQDVPGDHKKQPRTTAAETWDDASSNCRDEDLYDELDRKTYFIRDPKTLDEPIATIDINKFGRPPPEPLTQEQMREMEIMTGVPNHVQGNSAQTFIFLSVLLNQPQFSGISVVKGAHSINGRLMGIMYLFL